MLWYLMLTLGQANNLNDFIVPDYCVPPTVAYVPINGGLFPYTDGSDFANSVSDLQFTQEQRDYIQLIMSGDGSPEMPGKKTYEEAISLGWVIQPNDG
jgi:hypothetical protein